MFVPARNSAHITRRRVLAGTALGVAAAGLPRVGHAAPEAGGIINMHSYSFPPPNWHPHCTNTVQVMCYSGIYNQLVEYNAETEEPNDLRGDLATSWDLSKDGKVYTFHLDPKAKWHDGKPVTAEDVVYSLDSMVDKDAKPPRVVTLPAVSPYYKGHGASHRCPHCGDTPQDPVCARLSAHHRLRLLQDHPQALGRVGH
jgi:ABC-type transport system substrate-binding protein